MKHLLFLILLLSCLNAGAQVQLYSYKGVVTRCKDGDTFISHTSLGFNVYLDVTIRLAKIDAPEMKGKDSVKAKASKAYLESRILNKTIYFNSKQYDIYGRSIAEVYLTPDEGYSINQELVDKKYAVAKKY